MLLAESKVFAPPQTEGKKGWRQAAQRHYVTSRKLVNYLTLSHWPYRYGDVTF